MKHKKGITQKKKRNVLEMFNARSHEKHVIITYNYIITHLGNFHFAYSEDILCLGC